MGGHLLMSEGERLRKVILEGVREGRVTLAAAALRLEVSYRQLRRIWKRFRAEGDPGLIHRGRGRLSNRSKPAPCGSGQSGGTGSGTKASAPPWPARNWRKKGWSWITRRFGAG